MKIKILPRSYKVHPHRTPLVSWSYEDGDKVSAYNIGYLIVLKWKSDDRYYGLDWDDFIKKFIRAIDRSNRQGK